MPRQGQTSGQTSQSQPFVERRVPETSSRQQISLLYTNPESPQRDDRRVVMEFHVGDSRRPTKRYR